MPFDFSARSDSSELDLARRARIAAALDGWKPAALPPIRRSPGLVDRALAYVSRTVIRGLA